MKYAIIADIHGNLEAFQVVLEDIRAQNATHIVCLGDIVGYNANPKECLQIVRDMNIPCVKGNHDEYCSSEDHLEGFNPHAAEAVHWTRGQLTAGEKQWLRDLKYSRMAANFTMVHATLDAPERWGYVFDKLAAAASFTYQHTTVCFFGHTHVPGAFVRDDGVKRLRVDQLMIEEAKKYFINVGSVGQPRDGDWRAAYCIYHIEKNVVEQRRVKYDLATAQKKIIQGGLPRLLADRLALGR